MKKKFNELVKDDTVYMIEAQYYQIPVIKKCKVSAIRFINGNTTFFVNDGHVEYGFTPKNMNEYIYKIRKQDKFFCSDQEYLIEFVKNYIDRQWKIIKNNLKWLEIERQHFIEFENFVNNI